MADLGRAALVVSLGLSLYALVAGLYAAVANRRRLALSARNALFASFGSTLVASLVLAIALLRHDFSFSYVAAHTNRTLPTAYSLSSFWGGQEGSLLLWLLVLTGFGALAVALNRRLLRDLIAWVVPVLGGIATFFAFVLVVVASPFDTQTAPIDGAGLTPSLQNPYMVAHPPMLYLGYVGLSIPFAFAAGALLSGRTDERWIVATRRWTLAAWTFLGFGQLLGAHWAYVEVGWGGYYAWDPVENAALMPWLAATAFLHSVMIQEKRGMLKVWNVSLVLATGVLAILGTFLVRSGILESIHAFGASTLGVPFLLLIVTMIAGSIALVGARARDLRSDHRLDSLLSREAVFLLNNLVLVGLCFVVFWGTFFPLISEALTGDKASVGPPWFDRYTVPLALVLVLLSGIGPVIAWRKASLRGLARNLAAPLTAGLAVPILLLALGVSGHPSALIMFGCGAFALTAVGQEFWRGAGARRAMTGDAPPTALLALVRRNRRRYGGYVVHAGMAVLFIGVAASSAFAHQRDARLSPGQTTKVGGYDVRYVKPTFDVAHDRRDTGAIVSLGAVLDVSKNGKHVTTLNPSRGYYPSLDVAQDGPVGRFYKGESTSEVGLRAGLRRDLWTAIEPDTSRIERLADVADRKFPDATPRLSLFIAGTLAAGYAKHPPPATFRVIDSPLVTWIWLGGLIVVAGALIALWPAGLRARRTAPAGYGARVARELGRA
ncbi:MAG: heme lyase CcmF/NrfE family subunit [Solirubrobacteraceae bacterium]